MNELVRITKTTIANEEVNTVNARELWKKLESKRQFGDWIKDRLSDFIEGQDFLVSQNCETKNEGRGGNHKAVIDYIITLDVAKHIAMLERNEQGKNIRQYFIEIEKEYRKTVANSANDPIIQKLASEIRRKAEHTADQTWAGIKNQITKILRDADCDVTSLGNELDLFARATPQSLIQYNIKKAIQAISDPALITKISLQIEQVQG